MKKEIIIDQYKISLVEVEDHVNEYFYPLRLEVSKNGKVVVFPYIHNPYLVWTFVKDLFRSGYERFSPDGYTFVDIKDKVVRIYEELYPDKTILEVDKSTFFKILLFYYRSIYALSEKYPSKVNVKLPDYMLDQIPEDVIANPFEFIIGHFNAGLKLAKSNYSYEWHTVDEILGKLGDEYSMD